MPIFTKKLFYEVKLKWEGKIRTFYVSADDEFTALNGAVKALSDSLGKKYFSCRNQFHGQRDNFWVKEIEV